VGAGIEPLPGIPEEDGKQRGIVEVVVNGLPKTGVSRCGRSSDGSDCGRAFHAGFLGYRPDGFLRTV
jgi:hypothetical protein